MIDLGFNNSIDNIVRRLMLGASVYMIWKERNTRLFQGKKQTEEVVIKQNEVSIKSSLMSLIVKDSVATSEPFQPMASFFVVAFHAINTRHLPLAPLVYTLVRPLDLRTLFAQQAEQELLQTMREFHSCKQEEDQPVSSYVLKIKSYIDNLKHLGHLVTLSHRVSLILISLCKEFDGFVHNYNMHSIGKAINELHAMLKLHEQTLPKNNAHALHAIRAGKVQKGNKKHKPQPKLAARGQNQGKGKNTLSYAPKTKISPLPKREDPVKDSVCHQCGDTCHWKRNYPQYLAELLKNKKLS
nr:zinc finger, CCHC-type [Tanacetum cinerariifolium]